MRWVAEFVDKLSTFDCEMNVPVIQSEILQGIPRGALTTAGQMPVLCLADLRSHMMMSTHEGLS